MRATLRLVALSCGYFAGTTTVAAQDQDLMTKWTSYTIVRYRIVGEYAADPIITTASTGWLVTSHVTDRVELTFDWNQNETALVGKVTVKNIASTMGAPRVAIGARERGACPEPRVSGAYDHWTIDSVTPMANTLQLVGTRRHPAGVVPYIGEDGRCTEDPASSGTAREEMMLVVVPAMMFGMPQALGAGMTISKDGKSIVFVDAHNGWTWTYTPTGVR